MALRKAFHVALKDTLSADNQPAFARDGTFTPHPLLFPEAALDPGGRPKPETFLDQGAGGIIFIAGKVSDLAPERLAEAVAVAVGGRVQDDDEVGGDVGPFAGLKVAKVARAIEPNWAVGVGRALGVGGE